MDATIKYLTAPDRVLKESCDDPLANGTVCYIDQQTFKVFSLFSLSHKFARFDLIFVAFQGVWTKHVQYYLTSAANVDATKKYGPFLGLQSAAVLRYATNASLDIGSVWYAKNEARKNFFGVFNAAYIFLQGGSVYNVKSLPSGIMAHVAAAQYGPCL